MEKPGVHASQIRIVALSQIYYSTKAMFSLVPIKGYLLVPMTERHSLPGTQMLQLASFLVYKMEARNY
jgi:hypothetical protein